MYTHEDFSVGDFVRFAVDTPFGMRIISGRVIFVDTKWMLARDGGGRVHEVLYSSILSKATPPSKDAHGFHSKSGKPLPGTPVEKPGASLKEMKLAVAFAVYLNEEQYRAKMIDLALATGDKELFMTWSKGVAI